MTRAEALLEVEDCLHAWAEGDGKLARVGPGVGNADCDEHMASAWEALQAARIRLVEDAINQTGCLPESRDALRWFVKFRKSRSEFFRFPFRDRFGRPRRVGRIHLIQCQDMIKRTMKLVLAEPHRVHLSVRNIA